MGPTLSSCGIGFKLGDSNDAEEDAHRALREITVATRPLIVSTEAEPRAFNELTATSVSRLEGTFDLTVQAATDVSLWIVKFEPKRCGDAASMAPEFKWNPLLADGSTGPGTVVPPQQGFAMNANEPYRLTVKMDSAFGFCDSVQLRFEAHTRGL